MTELNDCGQRPGEKQREKGRGGETIDRFWVFKSRQQYANSWKYSVKRALIMQINICIIDGHLRSS